MKSFRLLRILTLALALSFAGQVCAQSSSTTTVVMMTVTGEKMGLIKGEAT